MKELYKAAEIEFVVCNEVDVIRTSALEEQPDPGKSEDELPFRPNAHIIL